METFNSLEQLAHRLQEEIYKLQRKTIPELQEKISNLNGSADVEELTTQIEDIKNNIIPALDSKFSTIESLQSVESSLSQSITDLDTQLTAISDEIDNLTQNVIPELEEKITSNQGSTGGSSSTENWITVYDMTSEDETLNWDYPDGIVPSVGVVEKSIDFMPYNYMRIYYTANGVIRNFKEFYIRDANDSDTTTELFSFVVTHNAMTSIIGCLFGLVLQDDGTRLFSASTVRQFHLKTSGYITYTGLAGNECYYVSKIEVRV